MPTNPRYQWTPSPGWSRDVDYTWAGNSVSTTVAQGTVAYQATHIQYAQNNWQVTEVDLRRNDQQEREYNALNELAAERIRAAERMINEEMLYGRPPNSMRRRSRIEMYADVEAEDL